MRQAIQLLRNKTNLYSKLQGNGIVARVTDARFFSVQIRSKNLGALLQLQSTSDFSNYETVQILRSAETEMQAIRHRDTNPMEQELAISAIEDW